MHAFLKTTIVTLAIGALTLSAQAQSCGHKHHADQKQMASPGHGGHLQISAQAGQGEAQAETRKALAAQTTCPVMGGKINKALFVDYQGQRIYMCCAGCKAELEKNPAKYIALLAEKGQAVEIVDSALVKKASAPKPVPQKTCPVMGGKIDKSIYADHQGQRVYFCCGGCTASFKKDPAKYLKILAEKGEAPQKL